MRYVTGFAAAFFLAALGASTMPYVKVLGVTPDLVLIFVACWATVRGHGEAMVVAPLAGLLRDLNSSDPLGTSVLALAPIVLLAAAWQLRPIETEFVPTLVVVAAGTVGYGLLSMSVLAASGQDMPWADGLLRVVIPGVIVNALFAPIVYLPVRWLSAVRRPGMAGFGQATTL